MSPVSIFARLLRPRIADPFLEGFRIPWRDGRSLVLSALSIFDQKGADERRVLRMPPSRSVECSCYPARVIIPSDTAARGGLTFERRDNAAR